MFKNNLAKCCVNNTIFLIPYKLSYEKKKPYRRITFIFKITFFYN